MHIHTQRQTQYTPNEKTRGNAQTRAYPCIWLQPTMNSQASTFTQLDCQSSDLAVRRPNGTIICNLCSDKTDHFPGK